MYKLFIYIFNDHFLYIFTLKYFPTNLNYPSPSQKQTYLIFFNQINIMTDNPPEIPQK